MRPLPAAFAITGLLSAGFAAGWFAHRQAAEEPASRVIAGSRSPVRQANGDRGGATGPGAAAEMAGGHPGEERGISGMDPEGLSAMIESMRGLDPKSYAEAMLAMEHSGNTREHHLYKIALEMGATGSQAAAYLRLHKDRRGLKPWDNSQSLRPMLTFVGGREGVEAIKSLLQEFPEGFNELDSLVHGVALNHPAETVEWYNQLPDGSRIRSSALVGMMWGLGHDGTDTGIKVFLGLDEQDQAASITSLADSYGIAKGFAGADELVSAIPEKFREAALTKMMSSLIERPGPEFVEWAAKYAAVSPAVLSGIQSAGSRWASSAPEDAAAWAERNAAIETSSAATGVVLGALRSTRPDLVEGWISRHPDHPLAASLGDPPNP